MNDLWLILSIAIPVLAVVIAIYAISTRGFKGAMFGDRITSSDEQVIKYRLRATRHTIRLHKMGTDELYGLELGRWMTIFGETSAVLIPRENLLQLRDQITQFVDASEDQDVIIADSMN